MFLFERKHTRGDIPKREMVTEEHRLYLHFILDTDKERLNTTILMGNIQKVRQQLLNRVGESLLTKAEHSIAKYLFVASGYEAFFQNALSSLKQTLAVATGDPAHDKSDTFRKEKKLLHWLNGMSAAKLCHQR